MSDFYEKLNARGIILPDTSTIQAQVEEEFRIVYGADIDLSPETPQGRHVALITTERSAVLGINAANANQINLDYCTGLFLDAMGAFFSVTRIGASSTRVLATVTGISGTVITANSLAKTDDGDKFYAENDITIPSGGSITGYFLSVEDGPIPCDTGTLTTIVSATAGWDSISNPAPATIGRNSELDVIYRARIKNSRYSGRGFLEDIKTGLESVEDLLSSFVYDNGESTPVVYDGITIDGNSIVAVVDGGTNADVAQAIFEEKDAGCGYTAIDGEAVLTFSDVGNDGETVTVAGVVYTLKATMGAAYDVQIGGSANATATSLSHAINLTGTPGTDYYAGTEINPRATSSVTGSGEVTIEGGIYGQTLVETDSTEASAVINDIPQSVTQNVIDGAYGASYPVTFNRPEEKHVEIEITVKNQAYSGEDLEQEVKDAILLWSVGAIDGIDGLKIGFDASPFEIGAAVSDQIPSIYVKLCEIAFLGGSPAPAELEIISSEVGRVEEANITVTVE